MATTLKTTINALVSAVLASSGEDTGNASITAKVEQLVKELANGTSNVQADRLYAKTTTLAVSGTETLDMGTGGGMLDALGAAFEPAEVVIVFIIADPANNVANDVVVGAASAEPFLGPMGGTAPTQTLKAGEHLFWFRPVGYGVTNNVNDKLKITNSAGTNTVKYKKIIVARSV